MKVKCYKNKGYRGGGYEGYGHFYKESSGNNEWVTSWCTGHPHYNIL